MLRLRGRSSGFTLLELIIVVIVIGILASIALPKYLQVAEKGRIAEAKSVLSALRSAQVRYCAQKGHFTANYADLDFVGTAMKYFAAGAVPAASTPSAVGDADATVVAVVARNGVDVINGPAAGYTISITQGGTFSCSDAVAQKLM